METKTARANTTYQVPEEAHIDTQIKRFFATENFGAVKVEKVLLAPEDQRALDIVKKGTKRLKVGYEIALSWHEGENSARKQPKDGRKKTGKPCATVPKRTRISQRL